MEPLVAALEKITPYAFEQMIALKVTVGWLLCIGWVVVIIALGVLLRIAHKRNWDSELLIVVCGMLGVLSLVLTGMLLIEGIPCLLNPEAMAIKSLIPGGCN